MATLVLQFFDRSVRDLEGPAEAVVKKTQTINEKSLLCRACGHIISGEGERIVVNNSHFHTCINPNDIVFDIGCFRHAPGCSQVGPAIAEHTWFAGYRWQIAVCSNCGEHLGWLFHDGDEFYGLITNRLINS